LCEDEKKFHSEVKLAQRRLEESSHSNKTSFDTASSKVRKAKSTQKYPKSQVILMLTLNIKLKIIIIPIICVMKGPL
jgi:hypothetical protein